MKQVLNKEQEEEKLQYFIFSISDNMEEFTSKLSDIGYKLDYSLNSLNVLEDYILKEKITNEPKDDAIRVNCWTYLGQVFLKLAKGASWEVSINDENTANNGLYVLKGYDDIGVEFVPIKYIRGFIIRKKKGFLKQVIEYELDPIPINLDKFPTEKDENLKGSQNMFDGMSDDEIHGKKK